MRLIYFDETGIGSEREEAITVVAAVIVHGDKQMPLINAEAKRIRDNLPVEKRSNFEFKANAMFSHFRKFKDESSYSKMMTDFLTMMRNFEVPIHYCAVNRAKLEQQIKKADEIPIRGWTSAVFTFIACLAFVAVWLEEQAPEEGGLCIADHSVSRKEMEAVVSYLREMGLIQKTVPWNNIVDTIYFGDSKNSIGIQMADYANFFIRMHLAGDKQAEPFYQIIAPLLGENPLPALF